jgi:hypothetical protein
LVAAFHDVESVDEKVEKTGSFLMNLLFVPIRRMEMFLRISGFVPQSLVFASSGCGNGFNCQTA